MKTILAAFPIALSIVALSPALSGMSKATGAESGVSSDAMGESPDVPATAPLPADSPGAEAAPDPEIGDPEDRETPVDRLPPNTSPRPPAARDLPLGTEEGTNIGDDEREEDERFPFGEGDETEFPFDDDRGEEFPFEEDEDRRGLPFNDEER